MGRALVTVLSGLLLVVLTACGSGAPTSGGPAASTEAPPPVGVALEPAANAADVAPRATVAASTEGTFTDVTLTASPGGAVAGTLSPDRKRWTPSGPLAYGATYTWGGTATGPGGSSLAGHRLVHHGRARADGPGHAEHRGRPRGGGGGADHDPVRGPGGGQGGGGAGAAGAHVRAHRGLLGLAARPGRRVAGALASRRSTGGPARRSTSARTSWARRSAAVPGAVRTSRRRSGSAVRRSCRPTSTASAWWSSATASR